MAFLLDLDVVTGMATAAALVICGCFLTLAFRDWRNGWPVEAVNYLAVFWILALICLVGAGVAYSPSADIPRKSVVGSPHIVAETHGKGGPTVYICVDRCATTGGYALRLRDEAFDLVKGALPGERYRFTYLDKPSGGLLTGVSLRLVGIANPESGEVLYSVDLTRHLPRMIVFIGNACLFVFTSYLCLQLSRTKGKGGGNGGQSEEAEETTALNLESR
jgi:hypothetical protein